MVLVAAVAAAALSLVAGPASAAHAGAAYYSPAAGGYAATGADFLGASAHITLPNASRFAAELGTVQFGDQMWNGSTVIDFGVVACTDTTCKPGGKPVVRDYRPVLRVFSRKTGKLICSAALGNCPASSSSGWAHASFRPGTSVYIGLSSVDGLVQAQVGGASYDAFPVSPSATFSQVRIAAEFGPTPFAAAPFRAPARAIRLATFFEPPGPPFEGEIGAQGRTQIMTACLDGPSIWGSFFTLHGLALTKAGAATHVRARPGGFSGGGCDFSIFLQPS
jgi:hypothetical protein